MATLNFPDAPDTGDIYTDSNSGFTYEWNGTVWISKDPSTVSNIREIDNISGSFNGSTTAFTLQVAGVNVEPANVQQLIISVGGVMQNAGDDYTVSGSTLTFTTAPTSGLTFFGTLLGTALSLNTVADGSVGTSSFEQPLTIGTANDSLTIPGNAVVSGILTAANAYVTGILTAQTLNYNNVVDIYSTGIITATKGIQQTGNEGLHVSAGITTVGIFTATKAVIGLGVTINNTGIDAGNAGIITAGTISSPAELAFSVAGEDAALRLEGTEVGIGTINPNEQLTIYSKLPGAHGIRLQHANNTTGVGIVNDGSGLVLQNYNSSRRFAFVNGDVGIGTTTAQGTVHVAGVGGDTYADVYLSNDTSGHGGSDGANIFLNNSLELGVWNKEAGPIRFATSGTERLRITSNAGFSFNNGELVERVNIVAGQLSDNDNIDLEDGMVYYFTTAEDTTANPNIRINSSTTLQSVMAVGDVCTVTIITAAAAAGYYPNVRIDATNVTEEWVGGEAPSEGGADGLDIYTYTIIKIADATGDSGFKVIANLTNATN